MKKKALITFFIGAVIFSVVSIAKIKAGTESGKGWLWGGSDDGGVPANNTGVGWISMNNLNCDTNGNGYIDTGNCGGADTSATPVISYGVNIPDSSCSGAGCNLSGYAWSQNIGWISFNSTDLSGCPLGTCTARRVVNQLKGWARIMSMPQAETALPGNAGGWLGWIKLGSETGDLVTYGITLNADGTITKGATTSYAWSNELGWLDFSAASMGIAKIFDVDFSLSPIACDTNDPASSGCTVFSITLTATPRITSTTTGNITYQFSCGGNGASDGVPYVQPAGTGQSHVCNYSGVLPTTTLIPVSVTATQEGIPASQANTVMIYRCGNGFQEGTIEECDDGVNNGLCPTSDCSSTCQNNYCDNEGKWIEVEP